MEIPGTNFVSPNAAAPQQRGSNEADSEFAKMAERQKRELLVSTAINSKSEDRVKMMTEMTSTMGEISDKLSKDL